MAYGQGTPPKPAWETTPTRTPAEVKSTEVQSTESAKAVVIDGVTDRVNEILNSFVKALRRLDLVTERINKFCDNADNELD